jgi:predicted MFS family arabinose efflux permease
VGIGLSAIGLGGPVFALIEQPAYGWSDPVVFGPLVAGVVALAAFVWWEGHTRAPMLPLGLFRSHNFSVVNGATLFVYGGLTGATFFLTLFLQQVAGYSPFEAGAATTPITVLMLLLSGRFGALASRIGPRVPMGVGPLLGAAGLLWLMRLDSDPSYLVDLLPGLSLFGVGLAMTVAPLTTTVLDAVAERRAGIASGVNNAVSRVAGLLAIAALGAVISAQFASSLDESVDPAGMAAGAAAVVAEAKKQPLAGADTGDVAGADAATLGDDITSASEAGFHAGLGVGAAMMALGGLISLFGVRNPRRDEAAAPDRPSRPGPGPAAAAGECGRAFDSEPEEAAGEYLPAP